MVLPSNFSRIDINNQLQYVSKAKYLGVWLEIKYTDSDCTRQLRNFMLKLICYFGNFTNVLMMLNVCFLGLTVEVYIVLFCGLRHLSLLRISYI